MKKLLSVACCMPFIFSSAYAKPSSSNSIDRVMLNFSAQKWVKTSTAKVEVTISATLTKQSLVQMRQQITQKLNTIAKGEWHITQFNRSQNASGLETLFVSGNARVEQSNLASVNDSAKKISQPGILYKISNIDFSPSRQDIEKVEILARHELYNKINKEVDYLNSVYKKQQYSLYSVIITKPGQNIENRQLMQFSASKNTRSVASYNSNELSVSNKLTLNANVILASNRNKEKI